MGLSVQQANFWVVETYLWLRRPTGGLWKATTVTSTVVNEAYRWVGEAYFGG